MGLLSFSVTAIIIIVVIYYVLLVVANWKIFSKAGEGGWKSIIPIYNGYILFKIAWKPAFFWLTLIFSVLGAAFSTMDGTMQYVGYAFAVVTLVFNVNLMYKLARSFGHGFWFTLGLLFFPNIFTLILGLGGDQYIGPIEK